MDRRLTVVEFEKAISTINVGPQTIEIARGVLVEGKSQTSFVEATGLTKGAVSQAVKRVRQAAEKLKGAEPIPEGFETVTAVLPEHQAFQVRIWAEQAKAKTKKRNE